MALKPCPFCGKEAIYVELYANSKTGESCGYVRCGRPIPCVAKSAIEEIVKPFMEKNPEFRW